MAEQPLNALEQFKIKLSIWREAIPKYEGGTRRLSHFIQQCDRFAASLTTADAAINEALFALIKSKISGEALDLIVTNNPTTWNACKTILINRYSDPSSEDLLFNKLSTCYQHGNQSYESYADEVKYNLNKLKEHIQLNIHDQNLINMKISFYENVAKNTFINGIKEPYHSYLIHFEPVDIEACLNKCRVYDNHDKQTSFLTYMRQREVKPKTNVFGAPIMPKGANIFTPQGGLRNFNVFQARPPPTSQSRPRLTPMQMNAPMQSSFIPANARNNVFGQGNQNRNQPTPMSISTRNTNRPNNNFGRFNAPNFSQNNNNQRNIFTPQNNNFAQRGNNFFRSTGPPNFISEELHHQEEQQEEPIYEEEGAVGEENDLEYENEEEKEEQNFQEEQDVTNAK